MSDTSRPRFSIRAGARQIPVLGLQDMPKSLRTSLWNATASRIVGYTMFDGEEQRRFNWIYTFHATNWPVDEAYSEFEVKERLKGWFLDEATWDNLYDFIEALPEMIWYGLGDPVPDEFKHDNRQGYDYAIRAVSAYVTDVNKMLEREGAPYRYRDGRLLPITNEHELKEISQAANQIPFAEARQHIETAAGLLAARPEPDFRNSIKESISAVESVLWTTTGLKGAKVPALLIEFEKNFHLDLHEAFKQAIIKLYGWTSDDSGVRHAISGEVSVSAAEARFMLVTCSAIVNFLVSKIPTV